MQDAGVTPYNVPAENLHIVPPSLYDKISGANGTAITIFIKQGIVFDSQYFRGNPVYFGAVAFHEMMHLKAHFSVEAFEACGKLDKSPYREGVSVLASQKNIRDRKYHEHFRGLHEAIVSDTEKRFLSKMLDQPELSEEKNGWHRMRLKK